MRTIINGRTTPWHPMPGIKADDPTKAKQVAAIMAMQLHKRQAPRTSGETFETWADRWIASRMAKGLSSAKENRHQLRHVMPLLGHLAMTAVRPDDVRAVVAMLDQKVIDKDISAKTARNVWGTVSKAFTDACESNDDLRVRTDDPTQHVRGPEAKGVTRAKVFLYPSEFLRFVACEDVPLSFRRLVTIAIYSYCRAGELSALSWSDVDLAHGKIPRARQRGPRARPREAQSDEDEGIADDLDRADSAPAAPGDARQRQGSGSRVPRATSLDRACAPATPVAP